MVDIPNPLPRYTWIGPKKKQGYLTAPLVADYARNIRAAAFDTHYPRYAKGSMG